MDAEDYAKLIACFPYAQALRMASSHNPGIKDPAARRYLRGTNVVPFLPNPINPAESASRTEENRPDEEHVSLYHDEHLPYSFLWWLNKTRMEYAHTYRPYAPGVRENVRISDGVLDQQIKENIFHLQEPEQKLSDNQETTPLKFAVPKNTDHIIERFIREEPKISPPEPEKITLENKARKSSDDRLTVVTETLANIYVEQGHFHKAIEAFEKLSLKFPEKSVYFAARIAELRNKII